MSSFLEKLGYFSLTRNLQKKVDTTAGHLASGLNGRLERGSFWKGAPKVNISRKDIPGQVTFYNGGAKIPLLFTRFILHRVTLGNFHVRIYNKGVLSLFARNLGMRNVEIGDLEFDTLFVVQSNDMSLAKQLLDSKTRHSIKMIYENQTSTIDEMADVPDSVKKHAADKDMKSAMKIVELFFTPFRPTFEIRSDKRGLCLEVFGLINQVEQAQVLFDELISIYSDWHLTRMMRNP